MLEVVNLVKRFRAVLAVRELSFCVKPGEIVGLLGPNGAGKTTTLRCICGILEPDAGKILVEGYDRVRHDREAKRLMAFIPETPNPYELLTVREHVRFVAMCYNALDNFENRVEELLERFELKEKENTLVAALSKGMKQKLAVVCALVHHARLFLCDEPLIGIDPKGQHELKTELMRLRGEGCAILISTHLLDTAERLCDRVIIMHRGRKLAEGTLAELRTHAQMEGSTLEELFLKLTEEAERESVAVPARTNYPQ
jgi:ABC-2 type transport system ATP-binding protein